MKIVVIDDEQDVVDLINYYFHQKGVEVFPFTSSEEAVRQVKKIKPDIVITDWLMPVFDGKEVLSRLKSDKLTKEIPVIMLSCMTDFVEISGLFSEGLADYLVKPINMKKLYDIVLDYYNVVSATA